MIKRIIVEELEDFYKREIAGNFGNNKYERERKAKAEQLYSLLTEFSIKGLIYNGGDL